MKIGYFGEPGTFSHEAADIVSGILGNQHSLISRPSFRNLVDDVAAKKLDQAVIPVENLVIGAVGAGLDSIIHANGNIKIVQELLLPVRHNLIIEKGNNTVALGGIKTIFSMKEATEQCGDWLGELIDCKIIPTNSTAEAVKNIGDYGPETAAIGSAFAARLYGKDILCPNIQDSEENATHFLVLAYSGESFPTGNDKTTIIFSTPNKSGELYKVLGVFNALDINLLKIESRPSKRKMHECFFWVDLQGHQEEDKIKVALSAIKRKTEFLKILGSYPKYE